MSMMSEMIGRCLPFLLCFATSWIENSWDIVVGRVDISLWIMGSKWSFVLFACACFSAAVSHVSQYAGRSRE